MLSVHWITQLLDINKSYTCKYLLHAICMCYMLYSYTFWLFVLSLCYPNTLLNVNNGFLILYLTLVLIRRFHSNDKNTLYVCGISITSSIENIEVDYSKRSQSFLKQNIISIQCFTYIFYEYKIRFCYILCSKGINEFQ